MSEKKTSFLYDVAKDEGRMIEREKQVIKLGMSNRGSLSNCLGKFMDV